MKTTLPVAVLAVVSLTTTAGAQVAVSERQAAAADDESCSCGVPRRLCYLGVL